MSVQILSNLNYPIGNIINQELQNSDKTQIAVAFLRKTGVNYIENSLKTCLENGGSFEIIVGLDFKTTDPKAIYFFIQLLKNNKFVKFYCFGDKGENKTDVVFHPKIYLFENRNEKTSIIGSTNLTGGGLTTNLEVNTIFKEQKPLYFSQLQAIYNSIKFTDTIFTPDEDYLTGYSEVFKQFLKNETKAKKDKEVVKIIDEIKQKEEHLPGTIPSLQSLICEVLRENEQSGQKFTHLKEIYEKVKQKVKKLEITEHYKTWNKDFNATIRGELNHDVNNTSGRNLNLFNRSAEKRGSYGLTENGRNYKGR